VYLPSPAQYSADGPNTNRAAELAGVELPRRARWHGLRRKFATEMKDLPLKDLCYLGGWKDPKTLLTCYQQPDEE
jgi:hypothetical protein